MVIGSWLIIGIFSLCDVINGVFVIVGIFSRLLGAIFYGVIFLAIAALLGVVAVTLSTNGQPLPYTDGSYFLDLVRQAISTV